MADQLSKAVEWALTLHHHANCPQYVSVRDPIPDAIDFAGCRCGVKALITAILADRDAYAAEQVRVERERCIGLCEQDAIGQQALAKALAPSLGATLCMAKSLHASAIADAIRKGPDA